MKKRTHIASGILLSQIIVIYFNEIKEAMSILSIFLASIAGSIFPDIDIKIRKLHRTILHCFLFYIFLIFLNYKIFSNFYINVFLISCLFHIFIDSFTKMGVPIFNPFGKRYGFKLIKTGSLQDFILFLVFISLIIYFIY